MLGKVIAFEGADGCGKTTLAKLYATHINARWEFEPDSTNEVNRQLREFCLDLKWRSLMTEAAREYLMLANRSISLSKIEKMIAEGQTVVCDRSFLSGLVYAKVASNIEFDEWMVLSKRAITIYPNVIINVTTSKSKLKKDSNDIYDTAPDSFHSKIRSTFEQALKYLACIPTIELVNFENDLTAPCEKNLARLLNKLNH